MIEINNIIKAIKEKKANEEINKLINSYLDEKAKAFKGSRGFNYLQVRAITSEEIYNYFQIGFDTTTNKLIISYGLNSCYFTQRIIYTEQEQTQSKYTKLPSLTQPIFNEQTIFDSDVIFITEGELNCLSIIQAMVNNSNEFFNGSVIMEDGTLASAIALGGVNGIKKLIDFLSKNNIDNKTFIIAFDNDDPGRKGTNELKEELEKIKIEKGLNLIYFSAFWESELNDVNDLLREDTQFYSKIIKNINKEYIRETTSSLKDFLLYTEELKETNCYTIYKTQFGILNKVLSGGLSDGLYILGAMSSFGKTTFLLNLVSELAKKEDILFFSTETPKEELMGKIQSHLAFLTYTIKEIKEIEEIKDKDQTIKFLSYTDIKNQSNLNYLYNSMDFPNKKELIERSEEEYLKIATNIFFYEGIGTLTTTTIKDKVKTHIDLFKKKPIVFIDYLQALGSLNDRNTDKQKTDENILELKQLAREERVCIFCTSSFNRDSYTRDPSMASFKESGSIEYGSDVLMTLHPSKEKYQNKKGKKSLNDNDIIEMVDNCKKKLKRDVVLSIIKNRNGKTNIDINYNYYAIANSFIEEQKR